MDRGGTREDRISLQRTGRSVKEYLSRSNVSRLSPGDTYLWFRHKFNLWINAHTLSDTPLVMGDIIEVLSLDHGFTSNISSSNISYAYVKAHCSMQKGYVADGHFHQYYMVYVGKR